MPLIEKDIKPNGEIGDINSPHKEGRVNLDEILKRIELEPGEVIVLDGDGCVYTENMRESNNGQ